MSAQPDIFHLPLSQLVLSPRNARKTNTAVDGLAASIAAHGLLQNLTVTPDAANADRYEVVAGGRRLAALQLLDSTGDLAQGFLVPCRLIKHDDDALEASTAENVLREAMHPADEFEAFRGMIDNGKSIEDVAAHFGRTELVVKQRLKLANVKPEFVDMYRAGRVNLDQLQALALTDDHDVQHKAWHGVKHDWERGAHSIRQRITQRDVQASSTLAQFVGLVAYEAAGGGVRRDLFAARDEVYLTDRRLLETLAMDRLEALAQAERDAGWSWAEAHLGLDYERRAAYRPSGTEPTVEPLTKTAREQLHALDARIDALRDEIDRLDSDDDEAELSDEERQARSDAAQDEHDALEDQAEALRHGTEIWPPGALAKAGVLIWLDHGGVQIARGMLQPGQRAGKAGEIIGTAKPSVEPNKPAPKKAELSVDMVLRLEMHRAAVAREYVAGDSNLALQLLLTQLLTSLLDYNYARLGSSPFGLAPTNAHSGAADLIKSKFADVGVCASRIALDQRIAIWHKRGLPKSAGAVFAWIGGCTNAERLQLLAMCSALMLETNPGPGGASLTALFDVNMAEYWKPTAEQYLTLVPKALLAQAVADVSGKAAGEAVAALKKDAAIAKAAEILDGTGWLPKPLRGKDYKATKSKVAPPKPAAKKASKRTNVPDAITETSP